MSDLQLQQHERDKELITLRMELSDQKQENKELKRNRSSRLSLLRQGSRRDLSHSVELKRPAPPPSLPRTPRQQLTHAPVAMPLHMPMQQDAAPEAPKEAREQQTEESYEAPNQRSAERQLREASARGQKEKDLVKEKQALLVQVEAEREAQRLLKKKVARTTEFAASFASSVESEGGAVLVSEYADAEEAGGEERAKLLERFRVASVELRAKQEKIQKTLQAMRGEEEGQLKERRDFERELAGLAAEQLELQKKIDGSKDNERRAQKILASNSQLEEEQRGLRSELKLVNETQQQRCQEQDELIDIQQRAVASLKANIAASKNRVCNNCLLYINEKQDFTLKLEQQVRQLQRMERDHHADKQHALHRCHDAMEQLERVPALHAARIQAVTQQLAALRGDTKALRANLDNMRVLRDKRDAGLREREAELGARQRDMQAMKDRMNSHDDELLMLEREVERADTDRLQLRRANDQLTTEVGMNATKKLLIKDKEAQLEDERSRLRRELEALNARVETLPKKLKNKILKK